MNRNEVYERHQAAGRMEVAMLLTAGAALIGSVLALASAGWLAGLAFLILASLAYGISRLFELMAAMIRSDRERGVASDEAGAEKGVRVPP